MFKLLRSFSLLWLMVVLTAAMALAAPSSGPRIPTAYVATTGVGQSDDGIPPDPYETFSYDLALLQAGVENFNVVYYTSVLPPESYEVPLDRARKYFHHGSVLESILAKAGGVKGDTVAAGIGRVWAEDAKGKYIGGFAAEYERIYQGKKVDAATARADAVKQLTRSLNHELSIRGLKQRGEKKFNITSLNITRNYGMSIALLGFLNFKNPDPLPLAR